MKHFGACQWLLKRNSRLQAALKETIVYYDKETDLLLCFAVYQFLTKRKRVLVYYQFFSEQNVPNKHVKLSVVHIGSNTTNLEI